MSKVRVKHINSSKQGVNRQLDWEGAISEARQQIQAANRRILMLEGAIRVFEQRRDAGELWPVSDGTVNVYENSQQPTKTA